MRTQIIKKTVSSLGFKRNKKYDDYILEGDYSKNIQVVYVRSRVIKGYNIEEFLFFTSDMFKESIVIGFLAKNTNIKDGVYINRSVSIPITNFSDTILNEKLNKIIKY